MRSPPTSLSLPRQHCREIRRILPASSLSFSAFFLFARRALHLLRLVTEKDHYGLTSTLIDCLMNIYTQMLRKVIKIEIYMTERHVLEMETSYLLPKVDELIEQVCILTRHYRAENTCLAM